MAFKINNSSSQVRFIGPHISLAFLLLICILSSSVLEASYFPDTPTSISNLSDVNSATISEGRLLIADGTEFESMALQGDCTMNGAGYITCLASGDTELDDLNDVNSATQGEGRLLISDGTEFESMVLQGDCTMNGAGYITCSASGDTELDDLNDVNSATQGEGRLLISDGTEFESMALQGDCTMNGAGYITCSASGDTELDDLNDVNSATQGEGRLLISDGTEFESMVLQGDAALDGAGYIRVTEMSDADEDTKIQVEESADEDIIRFDTGGTERMTIIANGNIGISTSAPTEKLQINQTSSGGIAFSRDADAKHSDIRLVSPTYNGGIRIYATDALAASPTGAAIQFFPTSSSSYPGQFFMDSGANNDAALIFRTAAGGGNITERLRITSSGNVGIGESAPASKFHINGGTGSLGTGIAFGDGDAGIYENSDDVIRIGNTANSRYFTFDAAGSNGLTVAASARWAQLPWQQGSATVPVFSFNGDTNTGMGSASADVFSLIAGGTSVLNGISTGNVGIGTSSPGQMLVVTKSQNAVTEVQVVNANAGSSAYAQYEVVNDGTIYTAFGIGSSTTLANVYADRGYLWHGSGGDGISIIAAGAGDDIRFFTGGETASDEQVRIDGNGNVGIGTSTPSFLLDVSGTAHISSSLEIPNGTAPTVDAAGEIAVDTTDDQLIYYGSAKRVLPYEYSRCLIVEELAAADDNFPMGSFVDAVTITSIWCTCTGTCTTKAQFSLEDGSANAMTHTTPTCTDMGTVPTAQNVTGSGGLTARESLRFDVDNTPSPDATDTYEICVSYTVDAQ